MAGPLIELLQGLRARRQRRRSGWGGGDAPSMRNMINPLDSQDMTDRAQGVDISSSLPSTRLETTFASPVAESFAAAPPSQQTPEPVSEPFPTAQIAPAQQDEGRSPFMTAAGSNASAAPMRDSQCPGGVCPTGPMQSFSQGLDPSQYGITLEPGQTLIRVGPDVSSQTAPQPAGQPATAAPSAAGQAFDPASAFGAWQGFMAKAAANPKDTNWAAAGNAAAEQAANFFRLHQMTPNPSWKVYYGQQFAYWQRESANAFKAHQLAQNLEPRQRMAEQAMNRGSLRSRFEESYDFLTTPNMSVRPDDRAIAYAMQINPKATEEQILASPTYKEARQLAHAADIANGAAIAMAGSSSAYPWGTDDEQAAGASPAWNAARSYYGAMDLADAAAEIEQRFKPAYARQLAQQDLAKPPEERLGEARVREMAELHTQALVSELAYDKDPTLGAEPESQPAPAAKPADEAPAGGWWPSIRAWGGN